MAPTRNYSQDTVRGDPLFYRQRLDEDSARLFLDPADDLDVEDLRENPVVITDITKAFEGRNVQSTKTTATFDSRAGYLDKATDRMRYSRTISICPSDPVGCWQWSRLGLTFDMLKEILRTYDVTPEFLDFVHMFGEKTSQDNDRAFGGGTHELHFLNNGTMELKHYDICYSVNYVVHRRADEDPEKKNPFKWSLRKTAVYHKFDYEAQSNTWITILPADRATTRVHEVLESQAKRANKKIGHKALEAHLTVFANAAENWRAYYNCLDAYLEEETANTLNCVVSRPPESGKSVVLDFARREPYKIDFKDLQALQQLRERVHEFDQVLEYNKDALATLLKLNEDVYKYSPLSEKDDHAYYRVGAAIDRYLQSLNLQQKNIQSILQRIKGRFHLLYNLLDLQNSTIVSFHEETRTNFQMIIRRDTQRNAQLNNQLRMDSISMKIITFVALIYLPLSFIATFMSAGITSFDLENKTPVSNFSQALRERMSFSKEGFALFMVLSVPLLLLTLAGWWIFDRKMNTRLRAEAKRKEDLEMA